MQGCLWISPGHIGPQLPRTSAQKFAATMAADCEVAVLGPHVWTLGPEDHDDMSTEVAAVRRAAAERGWRRYHLFGFSAGATVALATALAGPNEVSTLALFEPAFIGHDDLGLVERRWRNELRRVRRQPIEQRQSAFRRMLMKPGENLPADLGPPPPWSPAFDRLQDVLETPGFASSDLDVVTQSTLAMSGALSHPRFVRLAERLVNVMPHARSTSFTGCSHLSPPHRVAPEPLRQQLRRLWADGIR